MAITANPGGGKRKIRRKAPRRTVWADPLLGEWATWQRTARRSPNTIGRTVPTVQKFAEDLGVSPVSASRDDIIEWFESHPEWSAGTAHLRWACLAGWFRWLNLQGHRLDNPLARLESPRRPHYEPRPISGADLRRLLNSRMQSRTRVMILLCALAGLRVSEVARVRGEDVDLSGRLLHVRGKGGDTKTVPLHAMLVNAAIGMPRTGWWFPGRGEFGGSIDPTVPVAAASVSNTISEAMRRAGVRGTPHALRHSFATAALRASGDMRTVQALMRHRSIQSTQVYTLVADDRRHEVMGMLDPFADRWRRLQEDDDQ